LTVERVAHHEPGAVDLAVDAQEVAGGSRLGAAGLRLRDDDERAAFSSGAQDSSKSVV
jgi:hypothetical protein